MNQSVFSSLIVLILLSCNTKETDSNASIAVSDTTQIETDTLNQKEIVAKAPSQIDSVSKKLYHSKHKDDDNRNWSDTRLGGNWIKQSFKDSLSDIFKNDTSRSLYQYVNSVDLCNDLTTFEFEGCLRNNLYYLINQNCDKSFIGVSELNIEKKDTFEISNYYTEKNYNFHGQGYNDILVNDEKYVHDYYDFNYVWRPLKGDYLILSNQNQILDTIRYSGDRISKSDTLERLYLQNIFYMIQNNIHPTYPNSDIVTAHLYTGDMLYDSHEDFWYKATEHFQFDMIRTSEGFDLHNKRNADTTYVNGLMFKFIRI